MSHINTRQTTSSEYNIVVEQPKRPESLLQNTQRICKKAGCFLYMACLLAILGIIILIFASKPRQAKILSENASIVIPTVGAVSLVCFCPYIALLLLECTCNLIGKPD